MRKIRKKFSAAEKVSIMRRHFLDKVSVSDLCDEIGIAPTVFYRWQKQFFENAALTFERVNGRKAKAEAERIEFLEARIRKKDEVLGELMEEHVALKKELGEP
jgi:transposase-like protein